MYGTSGSLENNRTNTNYDKYVSKTAIYCNDRSTQNNSYVIDDSFVYIQVMHLLINVVQIQTTDYLKILNQ